MMTRSSPTQTVIPSVSTVAVWKVSLSVPGSLLTNEKWALRLLTNQSLYSYTPDLRHRCCPVRAVPEDRRKEAAAPRACQAPADYERRQSLEDASDKLGLRARSQGALDLPIRGQTFSNSSQILLDNFAPALLRKFVIGFEAFDYC